MNYCEIYRLAVKLLPLVEKYITKVGVLTYVVDMANCISTTIVKIFAT